ncbi:MAG: MBL fold metallo-hydrolase [Gemmatimonadetes bacterium]|nr:MBL fold metallo-hydrolase [Gemmatimonadota bacterium]
MPFVHRTVVALAAACLAAPSARALPPADPSTYAGPKVSLVRVADGVYATAWADFTDGALNSNSLVVINERDVLVVDTQDTPAAATAVIDAIGKLTRKPVRTVVTTHWHGDHIFGNQVYQARFPGVQIVGHPATREDALAREVPGLRQWVDSGLPALIADTEKLLAGGVTSSGAPLSDKQRAYFTTERDRYRWLVAQLRTVRIVPPTVDVRDSLVLVRGKRRIEIRWLGRGNTRGDLVVWLPRERVLASGDLLVNPMPYASGSYPSEWMHVLDSLRTFPATVVVPGHGEIERDWGYLDRVRDLLGDTRRQVYAAVAQGLDLDHTRAAVNLEAQRTAFTGGKAAWVPAFDGNYTSQAVERLWLEATGDTAFASGAHAPSPGATKDSTASRGASGAAPTTSPAQAPLPDAALVIAPSTRLDVVNARVLWTEYRGTRALKLAPREGHERDVDQEMFATFVGSDFTDGRIEFDVAGARREGYSKAEDVSGFKGIVGFTFRQRGDSSERFYLRPENARIANQLFRNRSTQYESMPDWPWQRLRAEQPGVYESYVDIEPGAWTHVRIDVRGSTARLYVNHAAEPCLVVNDLRHGASHGALALWSRISSEAYFANLKVTSGAAAFAEGGASASTPTSPPAATGASRASGGAANSPLPTSATDGPLVPMSFRAVVNARAEQATYRGERAVHLVPLPAVADQDAGMLAVLDRPAFTDGTITVRVAGAPRPGTPADARGHIGIAFRTGEQGEWSELFYIRPTNGRADDQLRRNHATQYVSEPDYPWHRLRRESPGVYEAWTDVEAGAWTDLRVEVKGTTARLFVNGATEPTLVVTDLKHGSGGGRVALWAHTETDAWFSALRVQDR